MVIPIKLSLNILIDLTKQFQELVGSKTMYKNDSSQITGTAEKL